MNNINLNKAAIIISTCFNGLNISVLEDSKLQIEGVTVVISDETISEIATTPYGKLVAEKFVSDSLKGSNESLKSSLKKQLNKYSIKQNKKKKFGN